MTIGKDGRVENFEMLKNDSLQKNVSTSDLRISTMYLGRKKGTLTLCLKINLNTRKMRPLQLQCLEVHNHCLEPGGRKILNFHDGL